MQTVRDVHPPLDSPDYKSTRLRHPKQPLVHLAETVSETTGPRVGELRFGELDHDLTRQHAGEPLGERIMVSGRLLDGDGRPIRDSLVEIWQANAAGRYRHRWDTWPAPLDPNFSGAGRCVTDADGRYEFVTVKPGPYPWGNHNERVAARAHPLLAARAGVRPAAGHADVLPGRPALRLRPDLQRGARPEGARADGQPLLAGALAGELGAGLRVRHRAARRGGDADGGGALSAPLTPGQTVGPFLSIGLPWEHGPVADADGVRISGRVLDGAGAPVPDALVETWDAAGRAFCRCPTDDEGGGTS